MEGGVKRGGLYLHNLSLWHLENTYTHPTPLKIRAPKTVSPQTEQSGSPQTHTPSRAPPSPPAPRPPSSPSPHLLRASPHDGHHRQHAHRLLERSRQVWQSLQIIQLQLPGRGRPRLVQQSEVVQLIGDLVLDGGVGADVEEGPAGGVAWGCGAGGGLRGGAPFAYKSLTYLLSSMPPHAFVPKPPTNNMPI